MVLAVTKSHQKFGIGKTLEKVAEERAMSEHADFVKDNSRNERTEAHCFYEHLGYEHIKTQKHFAKHLK